jgi:glycosyltransferase involved in cell wall biosynthesis
MKISIALATFNGAKYLAEQLDSIKRQSLQPIDLIISDDASSDDTAEIARRFARDAGFEVKVDVHPKLPGYNENFIRAIMQCKGDVVALCDQDDVWAENKLEAAAAEFRDAAVMAVGHRVQVVDEQLRPTPLILPPASVRGTFTGGNLDPWFAPGGMHLLFRRAPIVPWLVGDPPLSKWGRGPAPFDEWIFFLAGLMGKRVVMPDVLAVWRRHNSAFTGSVESTTASWSPAFRWRLARSVSAASYAYTAEVASSRAELAERVARDIEGASSVKDGATFYRRISQTWGRRARLHDDGASHADRLLILADMMRKLDYRPRGLGGLGAKSLLKDSYAVLRGPR